MSINRGMDKEDVVHIYNGILLSHKKIEIMPFAATWMDLEMIILSELSQTEKENIICYHLSVECKKNDMSELLMKQKHTHRHRKQTYGYQRGGSGGKDKVKPMLFSPGHVAWCEFQENIRS